METKTLFSRVKSLIITSTYFIFPLFFLPFTQEFFSTNKFYLLNFAALLLICISTIELLFSRKIQWKITLFDLVLILFALGVGVSTFFITPNPIQALLNPNFSLLSIASFIVLYFHSIRTDIHRTVFAPLLASSLVVSIVSLFMFFFHPFQNFNLPFNLEFLRNPYFTTLGSSLDLIVFLGFSIILVVCLLKNPIKTPASSSNRSPYLFLLILNSITLLAIIYVVYKNHLLNPLPPLNISWYASLEVLKTPITALFGAGIDNFSAVFTRVKDIAYNQSSQWQIGSFTVARSVLLHIFTESGLFGTTTFVLIIVTSLNGFIKNNSSKKNVILIVPLAYMVLVMMLLPPSLIVFFLFFVSLTLVHNKQTDSSLYSFDIKSSLPLVLPAVAVLLIASAFGFFLLGKFYVAEYHMRKSVEGITKNDLRELYDNQRQAILLNPRSESYRIAFSQTNAVLAQNIAGKNASALQATSSNQLTQQDRQLIAQTIQTAITQAKVPVALNPQKAGNWDNLASIYRSIISVADGADAWTISSYQRTIVLDPHNPIYRLNLGGVYFTLGTYDTALTLFEQASSLKPNWSNAHYNLAWTYFQKKDYARAVSEMELVLKLIDPRTDASDYDRVKQELSKFKVSLTTASEVPGDQTTPQPVLDSQTATIEPRLKLPQESSPETLPTPLPTNIP